MKTLLDKIAARIAYVIIGIIVLGVLVLGLIAAAIFAPGPVREAKTLVIPRGENVHAIAGQLADNGVIYNSIAFRVGSKLIAGGLLKAGEYQFTPGQSTSEILMMMHNGQSVVRLFTVPEGLTSFEIVAMLENTPALSGDIATIPPEGSLLPETYRYSFGDSRASLINRMQKSMQDALAESWPGRDRDVPLSTPLQALIMASVVEKETGKPEERPRIAGVFYNRLRLSMRLQSDPTVIYALTQGRGPLNRELGHDDLATLSPYNTYATDGLPAGPICNPGRAALNAALHPERNDYLYFVADGTGGHAFAKDLNQHNQNIAKWETALRNKPPQPAAQPVQTPHTATPSPAQPATHIKTPAATAPATPPPANAAPAGPIVPIVPRN